MKTQLYQSFHGPLCLRRDARLLLLFLTRVASTLSITQQSRQRFQYHHRQGRHRVEVGHPTQTLVQNLEDGIKIEFVGDHQRVQGQDGIVHDQGVHGGVIPDGEPLLQPRNDVGNVANGIDRHVVDRGGYSQGTVHGVQSRIVGETIEHSVHDASVQARVGFDQLRQ